MMMRRCKISCYSIDPHLVRYPKMISRQPFVLIRLRMIHEQVYRENIGSDIMILSIKSMLKRETRTVYRNLVAEKRKKTTIIGTSYPPSHHNHEYIITTIHPCSRRISQRSLQSIHVREEYPKDRCNPSMYL